MKKSLLFSAALVAAASAFAAAPNLQKADVSTFEVGLKAPEGRRVFQKAPATRASETMPFTYSQGIYSLTKLSNVTGGVTRIYLLFEMSQDDIKGLAGDKVTAFSVVSSSDNQMSTNSITEGRFFYSLDLSKEDYSQDFTMSTKPFDLNTISLDTPYTITGEEEELFFGYSFVVPKADNMFYIPFDGLANPFVGSGVFAASNTDAFPTSFMSFASDLGALTMAITVEGESYPEYARFFDAPGDIYLPLGEKATADVIVSATCPEAIESLDIEYTLRGEPQVSHCVFEESIPAGSYRTFYVPVEFNAYDETFSEDITLTITKINGHENVGQGISAPSTVSVLKEVPVHRALYEEYTGTWCGYCPRGFAALEYIKENYPEFVTASFHFGASGAPDPMQVLNYYPTDGVSGLPSAVLNRSDVVDPYYGSQSYDYPVPVVGDILAINAQPTAWMVNVTHDWASADELVAQAEVANVVGYNDKDYKIAYLLVADGLSGTSATWRQTNYYYSNAQSPDNIPELNQFCKGGAYGKSKVAGLVYNDVVVSAEGVMGIEGSVPTSLVAEEVVSHSLTFDLSKISTSLIPDKKKLRVIAMVLDGNGKVLNCAKDEVNDEFIPSAVEGIENAADAPAEFFNLNGMKVAEPTEGIYIRRQGAKAEKVIIR